ncbi:MULTISPECIES: hypothetical protein [unclassified Streptomyces]|uniref:hypothetical protein n=1 Tax=unclassified Streptomyces TaxID=2593676 RepID=UPI0022B73F41|nr:MULTISPECIES: hypothetical protein [unclassified Streptomyces]MCZ7415059.1 hypothetical protein [Streptomyces sp. WMMC897]MCZ7432002.1 hypothetical protein [Streptomyces sp. WMMC1477]
MAFSTEELSVLRRALATALQSAALPAQEIRECLHLALAVDDATREAARLRRFLFAEVDRYRAALPGSATGYLGRLRDALDAGYTATDEDVAALRRLCSAPASPREAARRTELLVRAALPLARTRLLALPGGRAAEGEEERRAPKEQPAKQEPGKQEPGKPGEEQPGKEKPKPAQQPEPERERPGEPKRPSRPIPTPGEVFPPRRKSRPPEGELLTA